MNTNLSRNEALFKVMTVVMQMIADGSPWCLLCGYLLKAGLNPQQQDDPEGSFVECAVYTREGGMPIVIRWEQDVEAPTVSCTGNNS